MLIINDVFVWAQKRLDHHRMNLESLNVTDIESLVLRGRIAELKELLVALRNEAPPKWIDTAD